MTRADLLALAAKVEAATGADRALDAEIARAAGHKAHDRGRLGWTIQINGVGIHHNLPTFTASLDAAASLPPHDHAWAVYGGSRDEGHATAYCVPNQGRPPWPSWVDDVNAAAAPLALTAAKLRALAHLATE